VLSLDPSLNEPAVGVSAFPSADGERKTRLRQSWVRWLVCPEALILEALALFAIFAPLIAPYSPVSPSLTEQLRPPSGAHWFGTDSLGMDVFSRVIYSTRIDLSVPAISAVLGILIGAPLGALAAHRGGWLDAHVGRLTETAQAFPVILLAMLVLGAAGNNLVVLTILLAILNAPVYVKMVRSVALPLREAEFVLAARCSGHRGISLLWKHILPNTLVPVFGQFSISCAGAVGIIAGLSFIGLGVQVPTPEWGSMINQGAGSIDFGQWWPSVFPGIAIFITAFALTRLGNRVRSAALDQ
jgi:peptide/nickel transport system permease protein